MEVLRLTDVMTGTRFIVKPKEDADPRIANFILIKTFDEPTRPANGGSPTNVIRLFDGLPCHIEPMTVILKIE
jgi:hypothetical protein